MKNIYDLNDKIAVVTGGAGGIGMAVCRLLGSFGAKIVITDINKPSIDLALNELSDLGIAAFGYVCDASKEIEVISLYQKIAQEIGVPDILVNNAAAGIHVPPQHTSLAEWSTVLDTSLTGYFLNAREFALAVLNAKKPASIVNIASIAGSSAIGRGNFAYSVAKGGVIQMTRELAIEWAQSGIRVNAIQPCSVNTPGWRKWVETEAEAAQKLLDQLLRGIPLGRVAEPEDIAAGVHFLSSSAAAMITGVILPIDGGNLAYNAGGTLGSYS
jgi:NAD(P)-dependent dehydrogenase (short-subunit alcohol dehydrogenase family)